jgi:hypothetical protein
MTRDTGVFKFELCIQSLGELTFPLSTNPVATKRARPDLNLIEVYQQQVIPALEIGNTLEYI